MHSSTTVEKECLKDTWKYLSLNISYMYSLNLYAVQNHFDEIGSYINLINKITSALNHHANKQYGVLKPIPTLGQQLNVTLNQNKFSPRIIIFSLK